MVVFGQRLAWLTKPSSQYHFRGKLAMTCSHFQLEVVEAAATLEILAAEAAVSIRARDAGEQVVRSHLVAPVTTGLRKLRQLYDFHLLTGGTSEI